MAELKIHTVINSRYQVFDRSGKLPFSIVFGLCRRSPDDDDPRSLRLGTENSILDVPYALSHKLLALREHDAESKRDTEVDVGQLKSASSEGSYLTLPSPVGRTENWKESLSVYQYHVNPESDLAALLKPGKKYSVQNKSGGDIGEGTYVDVDGQRGPTSPSDKRRLVSSRADGRATFEMLKSLPWPPEMQTKMRRLREKGDKEGVDTKDNTVRLEISVTNTGTEAITVQTRSRQRFLVPRGPMQAEEEFPPEDPRPRIIDPKTPAPAATIQIFDILTNEIMRETTKPGPCGLYQPHDPRPKLEVLTTLRPGEPLLRDIDVSNLLSQLADGKYGLRMEPRGMWWCTGDCEDFAAKGEDRVPHEAFHTLIPPLMLQCEDIVEIQVENGVAH